MYARPGSNARPAEQGGKFIPPRDRRACVSLLRRRPQFEWHNRQRKGCKACVISGSKRFNRKACGISAIGNGKRRPPGCAQLVVQTCHFAGENRPRSCGSKPATPRCLSSYQFSSLDQVFCASSEIKRAGADLPATKPSGLLKTS